MRSREAGNASFSTFLSPGKYEAHNSRNSADMLRQKFPGPTFPRHRAGTSSGPESLSAGMTHKGRLLTSCLEDRWHPLGPQTLISLQLRPEGGVSDSPNLINLCWAPIWWAFQAPEADTVDFEVYEPGGGPRLWLPQGLGEAGVQRCFLLTPSPSLSGFFLSQDLILGALTRQMCCPVTRYNACLLLFPYHGAFVS